LSDVNLDGQGTAEKTGQLVVQRFRILGDAIVDNVLQSPDDVQSSPNRRPGQKRVVRDAIDFDWLRVPFRVGHGYFVMGSETDSAQLKGPLLGASIKGKADLRLQQLGLHGHYFPLQGLNSAFNVLPGFGQILTGPKGEGVWGIEFKVEGRMAAPQVIVNPLSMIAPGIFRDLFQMQGGSTTITPRDDKPAAVPVPRKSSVSPAANEPVRAPSAAPKKPAVKPEVGDGGWSSEPPKLAPKPRAAAPPVPVQ
jgi:hypothetical protein